MSIENADDDISANDNSSIPSISQSEAGTSRTSDFEIDRYGFIGGGKEYTHPRSGELSVAKVRQRESKWLPMLQNWDKWISKKFPQIKSRCRKGIPSSLRGRAWQLLCGGQQLHSQNEGHYKSLLSTQASTQVIEDIEKDLHRQFPFHEMFSQKGGTGQQDLRDVLYAYSNYNSKDGYCQAQAPVAAVLLMHMPAEEAFWCMVAVFDYYIPGYYSPGLEAVQIDGDVMQGLLRHISPAAYKHLNKHNVSPMLYCTEWLLCLLSRTLPWPCVLRLWDMFFCEGIKILFRCALIIVKSALGKAETIKKLPGMYETLEHLKRFDLKGWNSDMLIHRVIELRIEESDLEGEYKRQLKLRKKQDPNAKVVRRIYRYTPTHNHRKVPNTPSTLKNKKKLNTISVNTPQMVAQALEHEQKLNAARHKKDSVVLTDYRRRQLQSPPSVANGDVASTSSVSGTSFLANNST